MLLLESGNSALANCLLEALYFIYLECPSNAQDLVPLGSKKWGLSLLIWASMFHLMMFNVCCGEFSSIGSIVRESVGQFNSLDCYSGIWWRKRSLLTSSSTFCRFRGQSWRSNLPALQDVLLWLLPMMAFSWFITKLPPEQGHQVWQRQLGRQKKVTKPQFLGLSKKFAELHWLVWIKCVNCVNCVSHVKCWSAGNCLLW